VTRLPHAIVFDFDGVLADTEPLHMRAAQLALAEIGVTLSEQDYYARYLGYDDAEMVAHISEDLALGLDAAAACSVLARKAALMPEALRAQGVLFPGAAACVRRLAADVPLAIASGALRSEIQLVLDAHGLAGCFRCIVAAGETTRGKPAPDPYARAIELLQAEGSIPASGRAARGSIAIEDSHWGLASARAAGLRCVGITTSYPASELAAADLVVSTLEEIDLAGLSTLCDGDD
jgi:beta-phosphoglucomutase-like phosphatase (HAD superfamily)